MDLIETTQGKTLHPDLLILVHTIPPASNQPMETFEFYSISDTVILDIFRIRMSISHLHSSVELLHVDSILQGTETYSFRSIHPGIMYYPSVINNFQR